MDGWIQPLGGNDGPSDLTHLFSNAPTKSIMLYKHWKGAKVPSSLLSELATFFYGLGVVLGCFLVANIASRFI